MACARLGDRALLLLLGVLRVCLLGVLELVVLRLVMRGVGVLGLVLRGVGGLRLVLLGVGILRLVLLLVVAAVLLVGAAGVLGSTGVRYLCGNADIPSLRVGQCRGPESSPKAILLTPRKHACSQQNVKPAASWGLPGLQGPFCQGNLFVETTLS